MKSRKGVVMKNESEVVEATSISWPSFFTRNRQEVYFIAFESPDILRINYRAKLSGETHEFFNNLSIFDVDVDNLKFIGAWEKLSKEIQDRLVKGDEEGVIEAKERMDHARKHRRNKYPNVPDSVTCCNCGKEQKMSPGSIVKNAEKWAAKNQLILDIEGWIKRWKCQRCAPSPRGRKSTGKCKPIELHCHKCTNIVTYPTNVLLKRAEKKNLTLEKFIEKWECQSCSPCKKGRKKKSK